LDGSYHIISLASCQQLIREVLINSLESCIISTYQTSAAPPKYRPADLAQRFKGATARYLRQEFPAEINKHIGKTGTLWSPSYDVGTAGHVSAEVITRYILECQRI